MKLDVDIEPTFRFTYMYEMHGQSERHHPSFKVLASLSYKFNISSLAYSKKGWTTPKLVSYNLLAQMDRQKVTHKSPPCKMHRWAQE